MIDVIDWCQVIDWYDVLEENDICPSGNQLIKMDDALDDNDICPSGNQLINMDHYYDALMNMDQWVVIDTWYIVDIYDAVVMQRWIIIFLSWLIRCTNGWTPKWSPYGESPHRKMLYRLSYPRRMVGGPMLVCGIMMKIS